MAETAADAPQDQRLENAFHAQLAKIQLQTDRALGSFLIAQWAIALLCAVFVAPVAWRSTQPAMLTHLAVALGCGGLLTVVPCWLAFRRGGERSTRLVLAVAQVLFSSLLIHLTAGGGLAQLHVFVSLAALAWYRDRSVLLPAIVLLVCDQWIRGIAWPQSMFGTESVPWSELIEQFLGTILVSSVLLAGVTQARRQLWAAARMQRSLLEDRDLVERRLLDRTCELDALRGFYRATLDALDDYLCILDADGAILETNSLWKSYIRENNVDLAKNGIGASYFEICLDPAGFCGAQAAPLVPILKQIIEGQRDSFCGEFECGSPAGPRWLQIRAACVPRGASGAAIVVSHVDITERALASLELRQQKQHADLLALVARYTDNAVIVADERAQVDWVNAGFTRQTGMSLEDVRGMKLTELGRGPLTDLMTVREIQRAIDDQQGFDVELVCYTKTGRRYWALLEIRPIRDDDRKVTRFICIQRDISAAKNAAKSLKQAKLRAEVLAEERDQQRTLLESILLQIPTAVFWKNRDGMYSGCNEAFAQFTGLTGSVDVVGRSDQQLSWTPAQAEALRAGDEDVLKGFPVQNVECKITDTQGATRTVLLSKTPLCNDQGETIGLLGSLHDISELKAAESTALSLGRVIRESPNEVFVLDAETLGFVEVNQGASDNLGYEREELFAMSGTDILPHVSAAEFRERIRSLMEGSTECLTFDTMHRRYDGSQYPVQVSIHRAEYGERDVLVIFATDQTEQDKLEARLAQAEKLESIGQLAAGIAHEINTPMQCVAGNVEFLMESYRRMFTVVDALIAQLHSPTGEDWSTRRAELIRTTAENQFEYVRQQVPAAVEEAAQASARITKIVRAMKMMSHPGSVEKTLTDVNELLRSVVTISRGRWRDVAEVELRLSDEIGAVPVMATSLSQVFINLIVNAADAVAEKYQDEPSLMGKVVVSTEPADGGIHCIVEDDGIGMDAQVQQRMFDPFFTTKDVGKGTGQGLSITYDAIVTKHQGRIDVDSEPGQGTRLTVFLPAPPTTPALLETGKLVDGIAVGQVP